eukprot:CAMPEP_0172516324 /NCGR_PEP_ID=MMETSP1066-20121228/275364_1 /TAXON_ID=671091 /ORGANISM="Coscinodiscus wailesii, Strain CCMP2513" /LENGTH=345 /DNA_ID=CAMNT_0013297757 /DNA_START=237 /DNA_END=1270 /DNA_ORIENTATION=-
MFPNYPGMRRNENKPKPKPYIPASSPYHPNNTAYTPYVPPAPAHSPPRPNYPAAHNNTPRPQHQQQYQQQHSNGGPPPPLSQLSAWFEYYDRDRSGSLDKEELISALIQTTGATHAHEAQSIRDTVYNTFAIFDGDRSGGISKREFCQRDGLGEILLATIKRTPPAVVPPPAAAAVGGGAGGGSHWRCTFCEFLNNGGMSSCVMCGERRDVASAPVAPAVAVPQSAPYNSYSAPPATNPVHQQHTEQYHHAPAPVPPKAKEVRTVRAPVPPGVEPGKKIKVMVDKHVVKIYIPDRSQWVYPPNGAAPYFEFQVQIPCDDDQPPATGKQQQQQQHPHQQQADLTPG